MQKVIILGSTGSLGIQALEVLGKYKKHFRVIGLSANTSAELLKKQAKKFKVKTTVLCAKIATTAGYSAQSLVKLATSKEADIIINVLSGSSGIAPTIAALKAGKTLLLGNKESLFVEGEKIMKLAATPPSSSSKLYGQWLYESAPAIPSGAVPLSRLIPLDSEHNAIYEILQKFPNRKIKKIIIPCSGGPFYGKSAAALAKVSATQALKHPRYKMGKKISIESATLLNKGLEIIEAHHLFGLPLEKITAAFHPECEVHGAVEFEGTAASHPRTIAYFARPDMREHLENAIRRTAGLSPKKLKIKILKTPGKFLRPIVTGPLKGLHIVLENFKKLKKSPKKLKDFLLREEKLITEFLHKKISFLDIFKL